MTKMEKVKAYKRALKSKFAWPGGYTLAFYLADGSRLCHACVLENWAEIVKATLHGYHNGWEIMGVDVHWEGPDEYCAHCNKVLPSEYGDPEVEKSK